MTERTLIYWVSDQTFTQHRLHRVKARSQEFPVASRGLAGAQVRIGRKLVQKQNSWDLNWAPYSWNTGIPSSSWPRCNTITTEFKGTACYGTKQSPSECLQEKLPDSIFSPCTQPPPPIQSSTKTATEHIIIWSRRPRASNQSSFLMLQVSPSYTTSHNLTEPD